MPWAGPLRALRHPRDLRGDQAAQDDAALRQHAQPGRAAVPGALAGQRGQSADRAASRLARRRPAAPRREGDGRRTACAPSSPPRRSTSASTGATSTSSSMSARRRAPAGWRSASAAPTTAWTSRRRRSWCRPTASRCWNAGRRSRPTISARRTRRRWSTARSTCWRSTCSACACAAPFDADELYRRGQQRRALCRPRPRRPSTASSISSPPAAMRCGPTSATPSIRQTKDGHVAHHAIRASPSNTG